MTLYHPLETYHDLSIDHAQELPAEEYQRELFLSFIALGIGAPGQPSQGEALRTSVLSDTDKQILVQTEIERLDPGLTGERKGSVRWLREMLASAEPHDTKPVDMYNFLRDAYDRLDRENRETSNDDYGRTVLAKMQDLPIFYQMLIRLHHLRTHDPLHPSSSRFWNPLISRMTRLIRHELVYLDAEIKRATKVNREEGDFLATAVMLILRNTDSPVRDRMLSGIFKNLDAKFTLNANANRYLTQTSEWLHAHVISPATKPLGYITAGAIALMATSYYFDFEPGVMYGAGATAHVAPAFAFTVLQRFLGRRILSGTAKLFDRALNRVAAVLLKSRRGDLTKLMELPTQELTLKCEDLLKKARAGSQPG